MKIKTITCHNVYNHGASLQEHALLKYLQNLGYDAKAINYTPKYLSGHFDLWKVSNPKYEKNTIIKWLYLLAKLPERVFDLQRKKAFDKFSDEYIKTTKKTYKTNKELIKKLPVADTYICGSDQIWNTIFENGKDPAFYLDFVPANKRKISYAASFAVDSIPDDLHCFVKKSVKKIDYVSVREISGVAILKKLKINNTQQVLDPVFLLDKNYWQKTFVTPMKDDFIFVYDFDTNPLIKNFAVKIAEKYQLKIFTVNKNITYADKNYWLQGPETFLSLIAKARLVLSNSFHAVAFSLIFNKQFRVFNREEAINTRMRDLLKLVDASYLLFTDNIIKEEAINLEPIASFEDINNKMHYAIKKSKDFLDKALLT